ncbi:MAG: Fe2+-dependent dioxygenase [Caulobacteraceae bacterium]
MIVHIENLLSAEEVGRCRAVLDARGWADGRATAGDQSALAKRNLQISETAPEAREPRELIVTRLAASPTFMSAALPARVFPPLFNRYEAGMGFGDHIDNAVRYAEGSGVSYRTDLSATLFLSDPESYDGGELVVGEGTVPVKLPAGDLVVYPSGSPHRVEPVRRGVRFAAVFWVQSMVRESPRRALLHDMDVAIALARRDLGDAHPAAVSLTGAYHNLIRMWADI